MPVCNRLRTFLDDRHVHYRTIPHVPAFTAQEIAAKAHVPGKHVAKSVMISADGRHYLVTTTANQRVDLERFKRAMGVKEAHLEKEEEFRRVFEDCEMGAMPPFGNLYGVPVIVDDAVFGDDTIAFNAGDHGTLLEMEFADFVRLVQPRRAEIAYRH